MSNLFLSKALAEKYDYKAPDNSEIRLLVEMDSGGICHCTLGSGEVSLPVQHKTVNEIWYCISGKGEIWQSNGNENEIYAFTQGFSFNIPLGNRFQFRNTGANPLEILIVTMPKWPGKEEADLVQGYWEQKELNKINL